MFSKFFNPTPKPLYWWEAPVEGENLINAIFQPVAQEGQKAQQELRHFTRPLRSASKRLWP